MSDMSFEQHEFVSSKIFVTNIFEFQDIKTSTLHNRLDLEIPFTKFMKAFVCFAPLMLHNLRA